MLQIPSFIQLKRFLIDFRHFCLVKILGTPVIIVQCCVTHQHLLTSNRFRLSCKIQVLEKAEHNKFNQIQMSKRSNFMVLQYQRPANMYFITLFLQPSYLTIKFKFQFNIYLFNAANLWALCKQCLTLFYKAFFYFLFQL